MIRKTTRNYYHSHKLKFVKPSVFKSNIVFYSTLNFKDRDYPEFDYIRICKEPNSTVALY